MTDQRVLEVVVAPGDRDLEPGDFGWPRDVAELHRGLRMRDLDVHTRTAGAAGGHKGAVTEIVVALGGSGALGAVLSVLRGWLGQRGSRTMTLTVQVDGTARVFEVRADGVGQDAIRDALLAALGAAPTAPAAPEGAGIAGRAER
ncbi:hypothetical protein [Actinoplanes sp. N902-109]|uniref:effector-associated constant component EACC1 n=1 Tax=Actinoplanes sp. (strain N902-109) TaxID=649831 RepID=UPI0012FA9EA3|nr:hypothetical protein [Actinoplanes sp. N902-109]